jgi:tetratricopeptide (TPR) repeat protein
MPDQAVEVGKKALNRLADRGEKNGLVVAELYARMARIQEKLGYLEEAEQSLRAAVTAKPDDRSNNLATAQWLYRFGQPEKADAVLRAVVLANADSNNIADLCQNIGNFYRNKKLLVQARDFYLKAYRSDYVANPYLYTALAETYEELKDSPSALKLYEQLEKYYISGTPEKQQIEQRVAHLKKELRIQ